MQLTGLVPRNFHQARLVSIGLTGMYHAGCALAVVMFLLSLRAVSVLVVERSTSDLLLG